MSSDFNTCCTTARSWLVCTASWADIWSKGSETKTGGVLPMMRAAGVLRLRVWLLGARVLLESSCALKAQSFTVEQILSAPFPSQLTAAETGARLACRSNLTSAPHVCAADGSRLE